MALASKGIEQGGKTGLKLDAWAEIESDEEVEHDEDEDEQCWED